MNANPVELFWISGSPFSWRVLLTFEAKRIPYTSRLLEASRGEHKKPDFLALNPRGKVPVLLDGEVVLHESLAIMQYLERTYPATPMFGRTPVETGAICCAISEYMSYLHHPMARVWTPLLTGKSESLAGDIQSAVPEMSVELARMEDRLTRKPWLASDAMSAADVSVYPFVKLLLRAAGRKEADRFGLGLLPFESRYPALDAWTKRVEALPGYERTYPPHWA
jgi:glutathione S-transferase